jgi:hypothetical protein
MLLSPFFLQMGECLVSYEEVLNLSVKAGIAVDSKLTTWAIVIKVVLDHFGEYNTLEGLLYHLRVVLGRLFCKPDGDLLNFKSA